MRSRVTYAFDDGTIYARDDESDRPEAGSWQRPFPNEKGNSFAFGMVECFERSDPGAILCAIHGPVVEFTCTASIKPPEGYRSWLDYAIATIAAGGGEVMRQAAQDELKDLRERAMNSARCAGVQPHAATREGDE